MSEIHEDLFAAVNGQQTTRRIIADHKANPPKDLHETQDPLRGRPVPAGTHQLLIEALCGAAAGPTLPGIHGRLGTALVG